MLCYPYQEPPHLVNLCDEVAGAAALPLPSLSSTQSYWVWIALSELGARVLVGVSTATAQVAAGRGTQAKGQWT